MDKQADTAQATSADGLDQALEDAQQATAEPATEQASEQANQQTAAEAVVEVEVLDPEPAVQAQDELLAEPAVVALEETGEEEPAASGLFGAFSGGFAAISPSALLVGAAAVAFASNDGKGQPPIDEAAAPGGGGGTGESGALTGALPEEAAGPLAGSPLGGPIASVEGALGGGLSADALPLDALPVDALPVGEGGSEEGAPALPASPEELMAALDDSPLGAVTSMLPSAPQPGGEGGATPELPTSELPLDMLPLDALPLADLPLDALPTGELPAAQAAAQDEPAMQAAQQGNTSSPVSAVALAPENLIDVVGLI